MSYIDNKLEASFYSRKKIVDVEAGTNITINKTNPQKPVINSTGGPTGVTWDQVTGKPTIFTPATHTHTFAQVTGVATVAQIPALDVAKITTGVFNIARIPTGSTATTVALGNHTHAAADIAGLTALLDGKAPISHSHTIADVSGLTAALDSKYVLPAGGTASTYLRGDNTWVTPTNTTYTVLSEAEFLANAATTGRLVSAVGLQRDVQSKIVSYLLGLPNAAAGKMLMIDAAGTGFEWADVPVVA